MSRKAVLVIDIDNSGGVNVRLSGEVTPAEVVFALELAKKSVYEKMGAGRNVEVGNMPQFSPRRLK